MANDLPDELRQSLPDRDYQAVLQWWISLSPEEQVAISDVSELGTAEDSALADEELEAAPETQDFYDYLVNHELRYASYLPPEAASSSYKIVSHYLALLGSELRHRRGTVE